MASVTFYDLVDNVLTTYQNASSNVTWITLVTYGGVIAVTWLLYKAFIQPLLSPLRNLPGTSFNPFFGNMREIFRSETMEWTIKMIKKNGPLSRYYVMFGRERLLVANPDIMKHILVTNCKNYIKPPSGLRLMKMVMGNGLVMSEGATHASHKRLLSPAFNNSSIKKMVSVFVKRSQHLVDHWTKLMPDNATDTPTEIGVQTNFGNTTLDIVGEIAFGYDFNSLDAPDTEINQAFQSILTGNFLTWRFILPFYQLLPMPDVKVFRHQIHLMNKAVKKVIDNKKELLKRGADEEEVAGDVLGQMLLARDEDGHGLTDTELRDEVMTLMLAGHETTAMGLSWCFLMLAQNPSIQSRARDEAIKVLPHDITDITWDHIEQLTYCSCVIKETLRLCPPVALTLRQSLEDDYLATKDSPRHYIPRGTISQLAIGAMMRREELFDNPNEFLPERFLDPQTDSGFYNYLPFLIGPRMCIGYKFALMEMRVVMAMLLRSLQFSPVPDVHFKRQSRITMRPVPSLRLLVNTI